MPDIVTSKVFVDGEKGITATKMNQIISGSTIQPDFVGTKPVTSTLASADQLLVLKTDNTYARVPFSTVSGSVAGQMSAVVIGDTTTSPSGPSIIVPRFKNHPDAIWAYGAFDDHFDGSTLNAKWTVNQTAGIGGLIQAVAGSSLTLAGSSPSGTNGVAYANYVYQSIPNANNFTITARVDALPMCYAVSGSYAFVDLCLMNLGGNTGLAVRLGNAYNAVAGLPYQNIYIMTGSAFNTNLYPYFGSPPRYWKFVYNAATFAVSVYCSNDGFTYSLFCGVAGTSSGFSGTVVPQVFRLLATVTNFAQCVAHFDWVKFTNP